MIGGTPSHPKRDSPAGGRSSLPALDRDLFPGRDESLEGPWAHMPREHVPDRMTQAGSVNEFRHVPRQSAVGSALVIRDSTGKSVARIARTRGTKFSSLITMADALSANFCSSFGVSLFTVMAITGRPL